MNNNYEQLADWTVQFGGIAAFSLICFGFILVFLFIWFWVACIIDVYKRDFADRNVWLIIFAATFFMTPFFKFLAAAIYYSQYKPKLKFWE